VFELFFQVQQAENCLVPDPELVNLLATAKVGSNSTPLAEILVTIDPALTHRSSFETRRSCVLILASVAAAVRHMGLPEFPGGVQGLESHRGFTHRWPGVNQLCARCGLLCLVD